MKIKYYILIGATCGLIITGMVIGMQSGQKQARIPTKAVPTLLELTARKKAESIINNASNQSAAQLVEQIKQSVQDQIDMHSIPVELTETILQQAASLIITNETLDLASAIAAAYALIGPFSTLPQAATVLAHAIGQKNYADNQAATLFKIIDPLLLSDEQRSELFTQIAWRLILAPNKWTRTDKVAFIQDLMNMANESLTWTPFAQEETKAQDESEDEPAAKRAKIERTPTPVVDAIMVSSLQALLDAVDLDDNEEADSLDIFTVISPEQDDDSEEEDDAAPRETNASLLHYLTTGNSFQALLIALELGANIHAVNNEGASALMYAAGHGHNSLLQTLLEQGATVHIGLNNALIDAVDGSNLEGVQILLTYGSDQIDEEMLDKALDMSQQVAANPEEPIENKLAQDQIQKTLLQAKDQLLTQKKIQRK